MNLREILAKHQIYETPLGKAEKIGRDMYQVPSRKRRAIKHTVDMEHDKNCSCEDKHFNKPERCFHVRYILALKEAKLI